jgi:hypothetical protein
MSEVSILDTKRPLLITPATIQEHQGLSRGKSFLLTIILLKTV